MTEAKHDYNHFSAIFSSGIDRDVPDNYIDMCTGLEPLPKLRFSSRKLAKGHFCNWTILKLVDSSWDVIEAQILEFLTDKSTAISGLPSEFSRRLSLEAYMYDDFHCEIDFQRNLVDLISKLNIDFGISVYFLGKKSGD